MQRPHVPKLPSTAPAGGMNILEPLTFVHYMHCKFFLQQHSQATLTARRPRPVDRAFSGEDSFESGSKSARSCGNAKSPRAHESGSVTDRSNAATVVGGAGGRGNWPTRRFIFKEWDPRVPSTEIPHGSSSAGGIPQLRYSSHIRSLLLDNGSRVTSNTYSFLAVPQKLRCDLSQMGRSWRGRGAHAPTSLLHRHARC